MDLKLKARKVTPQRQRLPKSSPGGSMFDSADKGAGDNNAKATDQSSDDYADDVMQKDGDKANQALQRQGPPAKDSSIKNRMESKDYASVWEILNNIGVTSITDALEVLRKYEVDRLNVRRSMPAWSAERVLRNAADFALEEDYQASQGQERMNYSLLGSALILSATMAWAINVSKDEVPADRPTSNVSLYWTFYYMTILSICCHIGALVFGITYLNEVIIKPFGPLSTHIMCIRFRPLRNTCFILFNVGTVLTLLGMAFKQMAEMGIHGLMAGGVMVCAAALCFCSVLVHQYSNDSQDESNPRHGNQGQRVQWFKQVCCEDASAEYKVKQELIAHLSSLLTATGELAP